MNDRRKTALDSVPVSLRSFGIPVHGIVVGRDEYQIGGELFGPAFRLYLHGVPVQKTLELVKTHLSMIVIKDHWLAWGVCTPPVLSSWLGRKDGVEGPSMITVSVESDLFRFSRDSTVSSLPECSARLACTAFTPVDKDARRSVTGPGDSTLERFDPPVVPNHCRRELNKGFAYRRAAKNSLRAPLEVRALALRREVTGFIAFADAGFFFAAVRPGAIGIRGNL